MGHWCSWLSCGCGVPHEGEPCCGLAKAPDDLERLDHIIEGPPPLQGQHVELIELLLVGAGLQATHTVRKKVLKLEGQVKSLYIRTSFRNA